MTALSAGQFGQKSLTKPFFSVWTNVAIVHCCATGWWIERVVVAENGLRGSINIVKYMNRLEFSSNMEVSYFYKMDYVNIAE